MKAYDEDLHEKRQKEFTERSVVDEPKVRKFKGRSVGEVINGSAASEDGGGDETGQRTSQGAAKTETAKNDEKKDNK